MEIHSAIANGLIRPRWPGILHRLVSSPAKGGTVMVASLIWAYIAVIGSVAVPAAIVVLLGL